MIGGNDRKAQTEIGAPGQPMKTLVAEDNPVFQNMLRNMLGKWGYEVQVAGDGMDAFQRLANPDGPRLALLDWMMPGLDGVEICRRIRSANTEPYRYLLLLTARTERSDLLEAMDAGADDYLTKPFNAHELRVRLRAGSRILELQEELVAAREALRQQATHDGLTGIWNRTAVLELLQKEIGRAQREKSPLAVLMADLDLFKNVNDTYGHLAGDDVLREASRRMSASLRGYDSIGRYGGEEFLIVMPGCDAAGAFAKAERMRQVISSEPVMTCGGPLHLTCSIGVACACPSCPDADSDGLVRAADTALYLAKSRGRNRAELARECIMEPGAAEPAEPAECQTR